MPIVLRDLGYAYFPVPKCACTSLKQFFFEVENGYPLVPFVTNGRKRHIHNIGYPTAKLNEEALRATQNMHRVAVVRDPVSRLLSCYKNRVLQHGELDNIEVSLLDKAQGVKRRPDFGTFVRRLARYRALSKSIAHHSQPLSFFLGDDPDVFSRIYDISQTDQLVLDFENFGGKSPKLGRAQRSQPGSIVNDLGDDLCDKIRSDFAQDYTLFGNHFDQSENSSAPLARLS